MSPLAAVGVDAKVCHWPARLGLLVPNLEVRVEWYAKDTWLAQYEEVDLGQESFDDHCKGLG